MQVLSNSTQPTINPSYLMRARYSSGRIAFPVKANQALYAHFKHVTGIPTSGDKGVSLSKLRTIDKVIDRLISIKSSSGNSEQRARIDSMIASLEASKTTLDSEKLGTFLQGNADQLHSFTQIEPSYGKVGGMEGLVFSLSA
ncbi:MAG: hypothetical protein K9L66_02985 [Spirochaetaceae bacterium]|nr:hypothetical protein [Spirochaetaceae bacterium]MCF7947754.1 hypothetical protein [Spirochaetia bacterium]MCF7950617.1 hypothetical protein [Spirochaetaceae bacterium]